MSADQCSLKYAGSISLYQNLVLFFRASFSSNPWLSYYGRLLIHLVPYFSIFNFSETGSSQIVTSSHILFYRAAPPCLMWERHNFLLEEFENSLCTTSPSQYSFPFCISVLLYFLYYLPNTLQVASSSTLFQLLPLFKVVPFESSLPSPNISSRPILK